MLLQVVNFPGYRLIRRTLSRQIKLYWSLTFVILQELELKINSLESKQSETTEKNDININEVRAYHKKKKCLLHYRSTSKLYAR